MKATPSEFLAQRGDWITEPDSIRAQRNEAGQWEVVMRLDGFYADEDDAWQSARDMTKIARSAVNQARNAVRQYVAAKHRMENL